MEAEPYSMRLYTTVTGMFVQNSVQFSNAGVSSLHICADNSPLTFGFPNNLSVTREVSNISGVVTLLDTL